MAQVFASIVGSDRNDNAAKPKHLLNDIIGDQTAMTVARTESQLKETQEMLDLYKHYEKVPESTIINQSLKDLTTKEIIDQRSKPIIRLSTLSKKEQEKLLKKIVQMSNVDDDDDDDGFKNSKYNYKFLIDSELANASSTANALPTTEASEYELKKLAESMLKQGKGLRSMLQGMSAPQRRRYVSSMPEDEQLVSKKVMFMILSPVAAIMVTWVSVNLIPVTLAASMGLNPLMILMKTYTIISSAEKGRNIQEALQIMLRTGTKELINYGITFVFGMLSYRGGITTAATDAAAAAIGSAGKLQQMWSLLGYIPFSRMIMHVTQDGVQLFMSKIEFFKETDHEKFLKQEAKMKEEEFKKLEAEKKELTDLMNVIDGKTIPESSFYQEKLDDINRLYESGKEKVELFTKSHPVIATIFLIVFSSALSNYIIDDLVGVGGSITESIFNYVPFGTYITGAASSLIDKQMVIQMIKFSLTPTIIGWLNNIFPMKKQIMDKLNDTFFKNKEDLLSADQILQGEFTKAKLTRTILYYFTNVFISVSVDELIRNGITTDFVKLAENHVWKHMPQPVKDMFTKALSGLKYGVSIPFLILTGRNIFSGTDQATAEANRLELEALKKELTEAGIFANLAADTATTAAADLNEFQKSGVANGLPDLEAAMGSARAAAEAAATAATAAAKAAADSLAALATALGSGGMEAARNAAEAARKAAQAALNAAALANRVATQNAVNSASRRKDAMNSQDRTLAQAKTELEILENVKAQIEKDKLALEAADEEMQALRLQLAGLKASKLKNPGTTQYDTGITALKQQLKALEKDFVSAALKIQMQLDQMKGIFAKMGSVMGDMRGFMLTDMQGIYSRASGILSSASSFYAEAMRSIAAIRKANMGLFALLEAACRGIGQNINGQGTQEEFTDFQEKLSGKPAQPAKSGEPAKPAEPGLQEKNRDLSAREQKLRSMLESLDRTITSATSVLAGQKDDNTLGTVRIGDLTQALGKWNTNKAAIEAQLTSVRAELSTLNQLLILGNGLKLNFLSSNLASFNTLFDKLATYANFGPKGMAPIPVISDPSILARIIEESRIQRQQIRTYNRLRTKFNDFATNIGQSPIRQIPATDLLNDSTLGEKIRLLQTLTDKTDELDSYMKLIKDRELLLKDLRAQSVISGDCGGVPCDTLASAEISAIDGHLGILNNIFGDISGGMATIDPKKSFFGLFSRGNTFDPSGILGRLNGILSGKIVFNPALDSNPNIQEYNLMRQTLGDQYDNFTKYQMAALRKQAAAEGQAAVNKLSQDLRFGHLSRILRERGLGGLANYQKYKDFLDRVLPELDNEQAEHRRKVQQVKILGKKAKRIVTTNSGSIVSIRGEKSNEAWIDDVDKLITAADNSDNDILGAFDQIIVGFFRGQIDSGIAGSKLDTLFGNLRSAIDGIKKEMDTLHGQINALYDSEAWAAARAAAAERARKRFADRRARETAAAAAAAAAAIAAANRQLEANRLAAEKAAAAAAAEAERNKKPEAAPEEPAGPKKPQTVPEQPAGPKKPEAAPEQPQPTTVPSGPINLPPGHPLHGLTPEELQAYAANRLSVLQNFSEEFGEGYKNLQDLLTSYTQALAQGIGFEIDHSQFELIEQTFQTIKDGMHTGDKVIDERIDAIIDSPDFEDMSMGSLVGLMTTLSQFRVHLAQSVARQAASNVGWVLGPKGAAATNFLTGLYNGAQTYLHHYDIAADYYDQLAPFLKLGDLDKRLTQVNIWRQWLGRQVDKRVGRIIKTINTGYSYDVPNSNGAEIGRLFIRIGLSGKGKALKDVFWNRLFTPDPKWLPGKETYDKLAGIVEDLGRLGLRDAAFRDMLLGSNLDVSVMNGITREEIDAYLHSGARTGRDGAIRKLAHAGKEIWNNHFDFLNQACRGTKGYDIDPDMKKWLCITDQHGVGIFDSLFSPEMADSDRGAFGLYGQSRKPRPGLFGSNPK